MVFFKLTFLLEIIFVLQMSTASPTAAEEEPDAAKMFSENELQRAKIAGISHQRLTNMKSYGLTFEEILKIYPLFNNSSLTLRNATFDFADKICTVLDPEHKTATNYTNAQETKLPNVFAMMYFMPTQDQAFFFRNTVCVYISQPYALEMDASSCDLEFIRYLNIRFLKIKAKNSASTERVKVAKVICCVYKNPERTVDTDPSYYSDLPDEDMIVFGEHWNQFETSNTSKALDTFCDFLYAEDPSIVCLSSLTAL